MKFQGYEIGVELNGSSLAGNPGYVQFSISDSIHDLLPTGTFVVPDPTGHLKDNAIMTDGMKLGLTLGIGDDFVSLPMSAESSEVSNALEAGRLSGTPVIRLTHAACLKLTANGKKYSGTLSDVLSSAAQEVGLTSFDIEPTIGVGPWWRAGIDQRRFIEDVLRPNMISHDSSGTPYFVFVDARGKLLGKSFASLIQGHAVRELLVAPRAVVDAMRQSVPLFDAKPFTEGFESVRRSLLPTMRGLQGASLSLVSTDEKLIDHTAGEGNSVPVVKPSGPTSIINLGRKLPSSPEDWFWKARINDKFRDSVCHERLLVTGMLDVLLTAGQPIDLKVYLPSLSTGVPTLSNHYNGRWLIERSTHMWNGPSKTGVTQLVIARSKAPYGSDTQLRSQVLS